DEKELLENNCCPMHLKLCVLRKEDNYYFALSKYKKFLEETLTQNPNFFQPSFRLNEVQSWIKSGLRDFFSISQASLYWSIPVPNDNKQTIYVWLDAFLGYVSALSEYTGQANLQRAVSSANKDHTLLELERQCLEVYRPKVEEAANAKAGLHCQGTPPLSVAAEEAELATLMAERLHQDFGLFVDLVKCGILLFCLDVLVYHVTILELLRTW
ncbi:hypothetical protein SO802_028422, partial [Lithocarpus litseifolius]